MQTISGPHRPTSLNVLNLLNGLVRVSPTPKIPNRFHQLQKFPTNWWCELFMSLTHDVNKLIQAQMSEFTESFCEFGEGPKCGKV